MEITPVTAQEIIDRADDVIRTHRALSVATAELKYAQDRHDLSKLELERALEDFNTRPEIDHE